MKIDQSRFQIGVLSSAYIDYDLPTALDHIAAAGFRYVEIAAVDGALEHLRQEDLTSENARRIRRELEHRGLKSQSFAAHTPLTKEASVERELPRLRFAAEIGCKICVGTCGPAGSEEILKRNLDVLVREAEQLGITLALETNADAITCGRQGVEFTGQWASPGLGVTYDAANTYRGMRGEIDILSDFGSVVQQIRHLHMKDLRRENGMWRFCRPGTGVIDTQGVLSLLRTRKDPIAVTLELPYAYRFPYLGASLIKSPNTPDIGQIDADMAAYLRMVESALAEPTE